MRRWIILVGIAATSISGCAEFRERQRLKTEMLREGVGMMKGMNGQLSGMPPGASFPAPATVPSTP